MLEEYPEPLNQASTGSNLAASRALLKEIYFLLEHKDHLDWERLQSLIDELLLIDPLSSEIEKLREQITRASQEQPMTEEITQQPISSSPEPQSYKNSSLLQEIQRLLGSKNNIDWERLGTLMEQYKSVDPNNPQVELMHNRIAQVKQEQREKRKYEETRADCLRLWDREQILINARLAGEEIINEVFAPALKMAEAASNDFPDDPLLKGLVNEAAARRDLARRTYEGKSTAEQTGDYKTLLALYQDQPRDKLIPWTDKDKKDLVKEPVSVGEAIQRVESLAEQFAHSKMLEYYEAAQKHIDDHRPRAALDYINKSLGLFRLGDTDATFLNAYREKEVIPLFRKLQNAEEQRKLAEKAQDPRQGWALIKKAEDIYPWLEGIEDIRRRLAGGLLTHASDCLIKSNNNLEEYEKTGREKELTDARKMAGLATGVLDAVRSYLAMHGDWIELNQRFNFIDINVVETIKKCDLYEDEVQDLAKLVERLGEMIATGDKSIVKVFKIYEKKYGLVKLEANDRLRELRFRVDQIKGTEAVIERLEETFITANITKLKVAEGDCQKALKEIADKQSLEALQAMLAKIRTRLRYQLALEKYKQGDIEEALKEFNWVTRQEAHPDAEPAFEKAKEINRMEEHLGSVQRALVRARASMEASPRRSYETLEKVSQYKTKYTRDLLLLMERARSKWEKKKVTELEKIFASVHPDANKIFALVRELSEELPEPRPTAVIENALAEAHAIEARGFVSSGNWESAVHSWEKAMSYNSFSDEIQLGWQEARIRQVEIRFERSPVDLQAEELETIIKEFSKNPQVWLLKAKYEHVQGANLSYSANARINFFIRATQALDLARDIIASQKEDIKQRKRQVARLRSDAVIKIQVNRSEEMVSRLERTIEDLQHELVRAESLAHAQAVIEEKLHANRGREDFDQARIDAQKYIEANGSNPQLGDWWRMLVKRVVDELIIKVQEINPTHVWQIFDIDSKILALDPNHQRAAGFRRQLPNLLRNLQTEIEMKIKDKHGLEIKGGAEESIIEVQLEELKQLRDRAQTANNLLSQLAGEHPQQALFVQSMGTLEGFIKELIQVKNQTIQARQKITSAKLDDSWHDFSSLIFKLNEAGYGDHRTVLDLQNEKNAIRKKREALRNSIERIVKLCEQEDGRSVERALALMDDYSANDEHGDPLDEFGLSAAIEVTPPLAREQKTILLKIRGWFNVETWLKEQKNQLISIQEWLENCGLRELLISNDLVLLNKDPENPMSIIEWEKVKAQVEELLPKGNYGSALKKITAALQGDKNVGWADHDSKLLALEIASLRLSQSPVSRKDVENNLVIMLLVEAEQKGKLIGKDIYEAKSLQKAINRKKPRWDEAEIKLSRALNELQALKNKPKIFRSEKKIHEAKVKVHEALYQCEQIAPEHPSLNGIKGSI